MIRIRKGYDEIFANIYQLDQNQGPCGDPIKLCAKLTVDDEKTSIQIRDLFVYDLRNSRFLETFGTFIILDWNFIKVSKKLMLLQLNFAKETGVDAFDNFHMIGRFRKLANVHLLNLPYFELPPDDINVYKY